MENNRDYNNESLNDMVFEGRNKAYGAYYLRKIHARTQWLSLFAILFLFILFTTVPLLRNKKRLGDILEPNYFDTTLLHLMDPPSGVPNNNNPPSNLNNQDPEEITEQSTDKTSEILKADQKQDQKNEGKDHGKDSASKGTTGGGVNGSGTNSGKLYGLNEVDFPPVYKSGDDELYAFLQEKTVYPAKSMKSGLERDVILVFVVELDGSITNVHVEGNYKDEFADEAIRVIMLTNGGWKPSRVGNTKVRSINKLPLSFVNPYR